MKNKERVLIAAMTIFLIFNILIIDLSIPINIKGDNNTTISKRMTLIHIDSTGDEENPTMGGAADHDPIDIVNIYENDNMSVINVSFVAAPASGGVNGDNYFYYCRIDSDHDNSSAEYEIQYTETIGSVSNSTIRNSTGYYWNGTNWTSNFYSNDSFAYIDGNSMIFNFSSCPDCILDNYYNIYSQHDEDPYGFGFTIPWQADWAKGSYSGGIIYFAGQSSGADLDAPEISNISLYPSAMIQNKNITVSLNATDNTSVDTILIEVETTSQGLIDTFELYDDGNHWDGIAGDNIYANQWNISNLQNGTYIIDIYSNDTLGYSSIIENVRDFIVGEIKNMSIFDGLYYYWSGDYGPVSWTGSEIYNYSMNNRFKAFHEEDRGFLGSESGKYEINNVTRLRLNSDLLSYSELTYSFYVVHTNLKINDTIYITKRSGNTVDFNVTDITVISHNDKAYKCWKLEDSSGSTAYYDYSTGIIIYGNFSDSSIYTVELDVTNAELTLGPNFPIIKPENKTYYYDDIPIICENETVISQMWYRNRTRGGIWSNNFSMNYNISLKNWRNTSILQWENGYHEIEIFANDTDGATFSKIRGFSVDDTGPEVYLTYPKNITYLKNITEIRLNNKTTVDQAWYRSSTNGSVWSANYSLEWNPIIQVFENDSVLFSNIGNSYLQVFANETRTNETALRNRIFKINPYPSNITWFNNLNNSAHQVAVDSKNRTYIVWYTEFAGFNSSINLLKIENESYSEPIRLNDLDTYAVFPTIAIDLNDVIHVAWMEWKSVGMLGYYVGKYTNNSGGEFSDPIDIPATPSDLTRSDIDLAVDNNQVVHFVYTAFDLQFNSISDIAIYYLNYSDGYFSNPENISEIKIDILDMNQSGQFHEKARIDTDSNNNAHIIYSYNSSNDKKYNLYYVNTSNLSNKELISDVNQNLNPCISISPNDILHIAWDSIRNMSTPFMDASLIYSNNTDGSFSIWKNITISKENRTLFSTPNIKTTNISNKDFVFISHDINNSGNIEILLFHNYGWKFSNNTFIQNISNYSEIDFAPSISLDSNRQSLFSTWMRVKSFDNYEKMDIILDKCDYLIDINPPNLTQEPSTNYTNPQSASDIWINGTAIDLEPSYGLYSVELTGSSTIGGINDWSLNVGNHSNWAFQNISSINSGTYDINITALDKSGNKKILKCKISVGISPVIVSIESPLNNSYINHDIPIIAHNSSNVDSAWYRVDQGSGWSSNTSLTWSLSLSRWMNSTLLDWKNGKYQLQVFMNDSLGREFNNLVFFTVDDLNPSINVSKPYPYGNFTTGSVIQIKGFVNGTISRLSVLTINNSLFNLSSDPSGNYMGWYIYENESAIPSGHYTVNITVNDSSGLVNNIIWNFIVDNNAPIINVTDPEYNGVVKASSTISIEGNVNGTFTNITGFSSNNSNYDLILDPTNKSSGLFRLVNNSEVEGINIIEISATDNASLSTKIVLWFYVDNIFPMLNTTYPNETDQILTGSNIYIEGFANGTGSKIHNISINSSKFDLVLDPIAQLTGIYRFENNSYIDNGPIVLEINITDSANLSTLLIIKFKVDNIKPTINITSPLNGKILSDNQVNISGYINGTVSNITDISYNDSNYDLNIDPTNTSYGSFRLVNNSRVEGYNSIEITVTDNASLTVTITVWFYVDTIGPSGTINYPINNGLISGSSIYINGTVNGTGSTIKNITINSTDYILTENPIGLLSGIFTFENNSFIENKFFCLEINITDSANFSTLLIIHFTVDNILPSINVSTPNNGSILSENIINITGYVNGTISEIISLQINDSRFILDFVINPVNQTEGTYSFVNITNIQGRIDLEIIVQDNISLSHSIILYFFVDSLDPIITCTNIQPGRAVNGNPIDIIGFANGTGSPIKNITINASFNLYINPISTQSGQYIFRNITVLSDGIYTLNITITDSMKKTMSLTFQFYIDNTPPSPPSSFNASVNGNLINLTWSSVSDLTNLTYRIYRNNVNIANISDSSGVLYYEDENLPIGLYNYTIIVVDDAGNQAELIYSVGEITGPDNNWFIIILIIATIVIGAVVAVTAVVIVKRRKGGEKPKKEKKRKTNKKGSTEPLPLNVVFEEMKKGVDEKKPARQELLESKTDGKEFKWYCRTCDKVFRSYKEGTFNCPICNSQLSSYEKISTQGDEDITIEVADQQKESTSKKTAKSRSKTIYHYKCTECGKRYRHDEKGTFPCPNCGGSLIIVGEDKF
ncbi:MAG: hypothetical protein GF329_02085 [Candidatus Lokiarchaeota archaeon]|nr:hypothetical protein [Candidatus Lokiarchaeota archaeon]